MGHRIFSAVLLLSLVFSLQASLAQYGQVEGASGQSKVVEIATGESMIEKRSQENIRLVVIGVIAAIIILVLFLMPGSFLRRKSRR